MNAIALLNEFQRKGIRLEARGDKLRAEAPEDVLTPQLVAELKAHKSELLDLLDRPKKAKVIPFPKIRDLGPAMLLRPGRAGNQWTDYEPSEKVRVGKLETNDEPFSN